MNAMVIGIAALVIEFSFKMMDFALKMMDKVSTMTDVETVFGGGKAREKGGHIGPRGCKRTGGRTGMEDFVHSMRCILH